MEIRQVRPSIAVGEGDENLRAHGHDQLRVSHVVMPPAREHEPKRLERLTTQQFTQLVGDHAGIIAGRRRFDREETWPRSPLRRPGTAISSPTNRPESIRSGPAAAARPCSQHSTTIGSSGRWSARDPRRCRSKASTGSGAAPHSNASPRRPNVRATSYEGPSARNIA